MPREQTIPRLGWHHEQPATRAECEYRMLRALATMRGNVVKTTMGGVRSNMPAYVHDETDLAWQKELIADDDEVLELFRPDRRDLSDWDTALIWFTAICRDEDIYKGRKAWALTRHQKVIRWRSYGIDNGAQPTWRFIGRQMESSDTTVRRWYEEGIDIAWRWAGNRKKWNDLPRLREPDRHVGVR